MNLFGNGRPDGATTPEKQPAATPKGPSVTNHSLFAGKRPDAAALAEDALSLAEAPRGPVPAWSFSVLKKFEECPYRVYLSKVDKIAEPSSDAADRGNKIHDEAEHYIRGELDTDKVPKNLEKLGFEYRTLREAFDESPEQFELEQNWGFTATWGQTGFFDKDVWCRMKLDVFRRWGTSAHIIDHKTGKKFGNELKHSDQGLQYAVGAFKRYPELEFIKVDFYYTDQGQKLEKSFTREQAMVFLPRIEKRAFALTNATAEQLSRPKPSKNNCKFCPHAETGACQWRVAE